MPALSFSIPHLVPAILAELSVPTAAGQAEGME